MGITHCSAWWRSQRQGQILLLFVCECRKWVSDFTVVDGPHTHDSRRAGFIGTIYMSNMCLLHFFVESHWMISIVVLYIVGIAMVH